MNYKVLVISFIFIMTIGYGSLHALQGIEPTMTQKIIITLSGLIISNLISRQWYKFKN
jgi:hypothetical protein